MAYYSKKRRNSIDKTYIAAGVIILLGVLAIILVLNIFRAQDEKAAQQSGESPSAITTAATRSDEDISDEPNEPDETVPEERDEEPEEPEETGETSQTKGTEKTSAADDGEQSENTTESRTEKTKETTGETTTTTKKKNDVKFDSSLKDAKATKSALKSMMKSSDYSLYSDTVSSGSCVSAELDTSSSMSKFQYLVQGETECILLCGNDGSVAVAVCDYGEVRYYANTSALRKSVPSCIKDYFALAYPGVQIKKCN